MSTPEVLAVVQMAVRYGIPAAMAAKALFEKDPPTPQDWDALWSTANKSYDEHMSESAARLRRLQQPPAKAGPT